MATYELGKIGLNLRGNYNASTAYKKLDAVTYNGSSYAALADTTGVVPTNTGKWMLLAQGTSQNNGTQTSVLGFDAGAKFAVRSDNPLSPTLRVCGNVVELHGEIQPTASISGSTTYYAICTIPLNYAPHHDICVLQQGSNQQIWMLRIFGRNHAETPGKAMFARCRSGSSWSSVSTSTWLPFHATWIV